MAERLPPGSYDLDSIKIPNGLESSPILPSSDTNGDDQPNPISPINTPSASINETSTPTETFTGFTEAKESIRISNGDDGYSDARSINGSVGAGVALGSKYLSDLGTSQEGENNGFKPRSPASNSNNNNNTYTTYTAPDQVEAERIEQYEPGVYITFVALRDGTRDLKRVRFRYFPIHETISLTFHSILSHKNYNIQL